MKRFTFPLSCLIGIVVFSLGYSAPNFTFVHISDTHAPIEQSGQVISQLKNFGSVELKPYGIRSNSPAFIINTGDMTEFGQEGWPAYLDFWKGIQIPRYDVLGNHDNTWGSLRDKLRDEQGAPYYSFDTLGCHFMILESATVQDPLPSFSLEQINWIKNDLKKLDTDKPIFVCFHHPLDSNEFVSTYERYRLLELFQSYNLACILVGHGHSARSFNFDGFDAVEGGSSFGTKPGFNLITISNNTLYVTYYNANDSTASKALLEKPLKKQPELPNIVISNPTDTKIIKEKSFELRSVIYKFPGSISNAQYQIDGGKIVTLSNIGSYFGSTISTDEFTNGVHYARLIFSNSQVTVYRTQKFVIEKPEGPAAKWRYALLGSSKSTPTLNNGIIYVGGTDGRLYAIDMATGNAKWTYTTDGEIITTPAVANGLVYFGSGDGIFYAVDLDGKLKWKFKADSPIYGSPGMDENSIYFGSKNGTFYAVRADSGVLRWKYNPGGSYCIEAAPSVRNGLVYYTAWDSYIYAIETKTGSMFWRERAEGCIIRPGAKKYFSAADSKPVLTKSPLNLFVSDRDFYLSAINLQTGSVSWYTTNCLAVSASEDGDSLYVRAMNGDSHLMKYSLDGSLLWSSPIKLNGTDSGRSLRYTAPAVEKNGKVYIASCWGTLYCVDANNGSVLWQYQITPQLGVMSTPAVDDTGIVYVTAMDGTVTAVAEPKK